jgi:putative Mn2+ efflux pump MntP
MFGLLSLGFTLSLDNFRSSLVLGGLRPTFRESVKTSAIFGVWDGVAPLVGILIGEFISEKISGTADTIAIIGLAVYGLFLIARAVISPERADPDLRWARFGLPVPLSVDNVAGGTALGLAGYSPWLAPVLFAVITFGMSLAGHQIGRTVAGAVGFVPRINTDLLTGLGFAAMAVLLALGVHLPLSDD